MENFLIRPSTWPVLRFFSRSPLMRTTDRVEAAVAALAVLLVAIAAVCAGVIGTMIHDTETQNYREQARTRHVLVARAVDDSAAMDALSVAVVGWLVVALAVAQVVAAVRAHLKRMRDAQWEREIRSLVEDDGGRTNHSQ
jgi:hypothetical protein